MGANDDVRRAGEASAPSSSAGGERKELLPRPGSMGSPLNLRPGQQQMNELSWPSTGANLLRGRSDMQEMLAWQSGESGTGEPGPEAGEPALEDAPEEAGFKAPRIWGMDARPFFPAALGLSLLWSMCMIRLQSSVEMDLFGASWKHNWTFIGIYAGTIGFMLFTALADPGMMDADLYRKWQAGEMSMPQRAHKHWLYKRPILRFHQYCRWITNGIGLSNHRQYILMLVGLVLISVMDFVIDFILVFGNLFSGHLVSESMLVMHLAYSGYFAYYTVPLLRQHAGFVARNELTQEYKRDDHYVVHDEESGEMIRVTELEAEEYNEALDGDKFIYDPERNPWDKGWQYNCWVFWCMPREGTHALGEF